MSQLRGPQWGKRPFQLGAGVVIIRWRPWTGREASACATCPHMETRYEVLWALTIPALSLQTSERQDFKRRLGRLSSLAPRVIWEASHQISAQKFHSSAPNKGLGALRVIKRRLTTSFAWPRPNEKHSIDERSTYSGHTVYSGDSVHLSLAATTTASETMAGGETSPHTFTG